MNELFQKHFELRLKQVRNILDQENLDSLIIENGFPQYYFLDDQTTPFKANPNFLFFCPDYGEGHVLKITKDNKPKLYYYIPNDFWHETSQLQNFFWEPYFDIEIFSDYDNLWKNLTVQQGQNVILSPLPDLGIENGCIEISDSILSQLHWMRISKTQYEIECVKQATQIASLGHKAAEQSFLNGKSEFDSFNAFLLSSAQKQFDLPYGNIIAYNEKAAVLHYQKTRKDVVGKSFLIDAGARFQGYCSDITRTHYTNDAHSVFKDLHSRLDEIQLELCKMVVPNKDYIDIQVLAHQKITALLCELKIFTTSLDEALTLKLSQSFFPHGVGHALGIQVHDVGGKQKNEQGQSCVKDSDHPYLRTLRKIQINDILTVEPGVYFIPMLLKELKTNLKSNKSINWNLVEELIPFGGIRIEDNVVASLEKPNNLTRLFLPN
jgi:Xaa-Pro dipeptidase